MSLLGGLNGSAMYGLKLPARCLAAVLGNAAAQHSATDKPASSSSSAANAALPGSAPQPDHNPHSHRFLVGTCSPLRRSPQHSDSGSATPSAAAGENEIHVLEFDEEENEIRSTHIYSHPQEIWNLTSCPSDAQICATVYSQDDSYHATLWRMSDQLASPSSRTSSGAQALTKLVDLKGHEGRIKGVVWNPTEGARSLLSLDSSCLRVWDLAESCASLAKPASTASGPLVGGPNAACWDPHHAHLLASADGAHIRSWDTRAFSAPTLSMEHAHEDLIADVDFNPNKPHHLLSSSRDRRACLWDLRFPLRPLRTLLHHSHWLWVGRFNRFHDQLVLTAGTEMVNLWSLIENSSAPVGELEAAHAGSHTKPATGGGAQDSQGGHKDHGGGGATGGAADSLIQTYSDHEDSVYAAAWSSYDAWIFATLSYDGRLCVNHVPPAEKYKILL